MSHRHHVQATAFTALLTLLAACSSTTYNEVVSTDVATEIPTETPTEITTEVATESATEDTTQPPNLVDELNTFWESEADELNIDYEAVPADRVSDGTDGATCDGVLLSGDDIDDNAFVDAECSEGLIVGYDPAYLDGTQNLEGRLVLAHEWGHVVQAQSVEIDLFELDGRSIDSELQADCFSGAWATTAVDADRLGEMQDSIRAIGDDPDVPVDDPEAHGTPDKRVEAFMVGYNVGATACIGDELIDILPF